MSDYTDCESYKQLAEKYNEEKQQTLEGTQRISQELEAIKEKIKEMKNESFFKRMRHSSKLKELEAKAIELARRKQHINRNYLSFLNIFYLSQCSRCHCHFCPYETLVKTDYVKWSNG